MKLKTKFQDEDFDLGEVVEANIYYGGSGRIKVIAEPVRGGMITFYFETLKGMNEMFEDVPEEPKEYWYISDFGYVFNHEINNKSVKSTIEEMKSIGNYFDSREEAEKAVEKLKAFKRLKDKGFRFTGYTHKDRGRLDELEIYCQLGECPENIEEMDDVHLLFGGEK